MLKYQLDSSCVIMSSILLTTVFYKAVILQGEIWRWSLLGLTIYMGKPEIPVAKSSGSRHSVWDSSENMGCDLRRIHFPALFSLLRYLFNDLLFFRFQLKGPCILWLVRPGINWVFLERAPLKTTHLMWQILVRPRDQGLTIQTSGHSLPRFVVLLIYQRR